MAGPVLEARNLVKHFPVKRGIFSRQVGAVRAVDDISFTIDPGKTLGLVGESGCGKTTTAKMVLLLEQPTGGIRRFEGQDLQTLDGGSLKAYRRSVQAVFQDPYASLNPRMRVGSIIMEPLITNEPLPSVEVRKRLLRLLELVGLPERAADLFPHEFSGGQRQRIAIARALSLSPKVVVLDEPVSALDVSIRAQILNLLRDLQAQLGVSYLFIAHDLAAVAHMSHTIAVMYLGKIVELGDAERVSKAPTHPHAQSKPDVVVYIEDDRRWTWRELLERRNRLANSLVKAGVGRGEHVVVYAPNSLEYLLAASATRAANAVPVPMNHRLVAEEALYILDHSDAVAAFVGGPFVAMADAIRRHAAKLRLWVLMGGARRPWAVSLDH